MRLNTFPRFKDGAACRSVLGRILPLGFAAILAGCASLSSQSGAPRLDAAYVILGADGAPIARALTGAASCPAIELDGRSTPMQVRAPYAPIPLRPLPPGPDGKPRPMPQSRPVLACELAIPAGTGSARIAGQPLPLPKADLRRIVVIGDTGCRLKGKDFQDCNDPNAYPFARVAASAAAWKPDLVVHVGDMHYREDPCPTGRAGCAGSPWGYGWDAWNADFFTPGRKLLAAAPWVAARGNHESCARAGQGWMRFLDPWPYGAARSCDRPQDDDGADYSDPYVVPIGGDAQLLVFDSANTSYKGFKPGDIRIERYAELRRKIGELAQRARHTIAVDHHPLYGFGALHDTKSGANSGAIRLFGGDAGLIQEFGAASQRLLPSNVEVLLSGHVHLQEQVSFSTDFPSQFVAGFSGTAEDIVPLPASVPPDTQPAPGAEVEALSSWIDGFGFMTMERTGPYTWQVVIRDRNGAPVNTCSVDGRHSRCVEDQVLYKK